MSLTFQELRDVSAERNKHWHPGFTTGDDGWTKGDWSNALQGEVGEAIEALFFLAESSAKLVIASGRAGNYVKKLRRYEENINGTNDPPVEKLYENIGAELADVVLYADLLANKLGIDLEGALKKKFNSVSRKMDFPQRL